MQFLHQQKDPDGLTSVYIKKRGHARSPFLRKPMKYSHSSGFTLLELLIVIAIIGILAAVVLASLSSSRVKARDTQRVAQLKEIEKALALYYTEYGQYPDGAEIGGTQNWFSNTSIGELVTEGYMPVLPADPVYGSGLGGYHYCTDSQPTTGYVLYANVEHDGDPEGWCQLPRGNATECASYTTGDMNAGSVQCSDI